MKKLAAFLIISISTFSCAYDYNCYCLENDIGVGSKTFNNMKRKAAESQCSSFQTTIIVDNPEATCEIMQNY